MTEYNLNIGEKMNPAKVAPGADDSPVTQESLDHLLNKKLEKLSGAIQGEFGQVNARLGDVKSVSTLPRKLEGRRSLRI